MMILIGIAPLAKASGRFTLKSLVMAGLLVGCAALVKPFFGGLYTKVAKRHRYPLDKIATFR